MSDPEYTTPSAHLAKSSVRKQWLVPGTKSVLGLALYIGAFCAFVDDPFRCSGETTLTPQAHCYSGICSRNHRICKYAHRSGYRPFKRHWESNCPPLSG